MNRVFLSSLFFLFFLFFFSRYNDSYFVADNSTVSFFFACFYFTVIWIENYPTRLCFSTHSTSHNIAVSTSACACAWFSSDNRNEKRKQHRKKKWMNTKKNCLHQRHYYSRFFQCHYICRRKKSHKKHLFFSLVLFV
jgi:hypothetical protein